jgi:hypothetical protein
MGHAGGCLRAASLWGRIVIGVLVLLSVVLPTAPAHADKPPFVYFLMDTNRPLTVREKDIWVVASIIDRMRAEQPGTRFFFHLTNVRAAVSNLLFDGTRETIYKQAMDIYRLPSPDKIPATLHDLRTMVQELRYISANMRELAIPADTPKWIIAFHDLDLIDAERRVSSEGRFLGDGWISSPRSPFRTDFLSQDNAPLKNTRFVVFQSKPADLFVRRGKEGFYARLLRAVEADLLYMGPLYPIGAQAPLALGYFQALREDRLYPMPAGTPLDAALLQIIGGDRVVETISAYQ